MNRLPTQRRRDRALKSACRGTASLGFETMESRQVLAACPGFATPSLLRAHAFDGVVPLATTGATGFSPAQIRQAYGFASVSFGGTAADGSGTTIAIVDAFDNPNIANDLKQFDAAFGLPDPVFRKVNQTGGTTMPRADAGWASEIALDVEWAHAIAPGASILLVEANSNSYTDLMTAVDYARNQPGVVAVSLSWGGGEFSGETTYDAYFTTPAGHPGVTFFASSGDTGAPTSYPSASPNVVSVGGTSLFLSGSGYSSESGWSGSGGGISAYESQPSYQKGVVTQSSTRRASPDIAYNSDPNTGFPVYDSYNNTGAAKWSQFGGTSAAAPQWAALAAIADQGRSLAGLGSLDGRSQFLPAIYRMAAADFHDVTTGGSAGTPKYSASAGYDLVTGRGTPVANLVIADLVVWGTSTTPPASAPSAPTAFSGVAASATQVNLSWGASGNADGYRLYQVSGNTATLIGTLAATATSATVTGLNAGTAYTFRLDAYNAAGSGSATTQVTTPAATAIAAPANVTVTILSRTSVQVSWTASAGATGYRVLMDNGTTTSQVASVGSATTSVRISNLSRGRTYGFAVTAANATSSATSAFTSVTMPAALAAPQGLVFTMSSAGTGTLSWSAVSGATWYLVYAADTSSRGRSSAWVDAATTSIDVSGLRAGRSYQFCVIAVNDSESTASVWLVTGVAATASVRTKTSNGGCVRVV